MALLKINAAAKLNLYLHVTSKRDDGYHELDSFVCFTEFGDYLTLDPTKAFSLEVNGPFSKGLNTKDNLILKAVQDLTTYAGKDPIGKITLTKNIPVAAGLGGGSADAAATIRLYEQLWDIKAPDDLLLSLGADVPVCYAGASCRMSGIGEKIEPLENPFKDMVVLLLNPNTPLSTKEVFQNLGYSFDAPIKEIDKNTITDAHNSLQETSVKLCPGIQTGLSFLRSQNGCIYARMAGSGPTIFGIFKDTNKANTAHKNAAKELSDWWSQLTNLG